MAAETGKKPACLDAPAEVFGPPGSSAFGRAVSFERLEKGRDLDAASSDGYRIFVGDLRERWGEETWMGSSKKVSSRDLGGGRASCWRFTESKIAVPARRSG